MSKQVTIKVEPGVAVALSDRKTSSVHGGTYDLDEKYAREALKRKGVTEVKPAGTGAGKEVDGPK